VAVFTAVLVALMAAPALSQQVEAEAGPAVLRWGGWQIYGASARLEGDAIVFERAHATVDAPERWTLVADRLEIGFRLGAVGRVERLSARGGVRLVGPNDLYVTGERLVSLRPDRRLDFVGPHPPGVIGERWRLTGRRLTVELRSGRVDIEGVGEAGARQRPTGSSSVELGITTTMACNIGEPSDDPTGEE
jgi:hypothetical protein